MLYFIPNRVDLRGHWHVYPQYDARLGDIDYAVMEIADDRTGIFGESNFTRAFNGQIDTRKRTIEFGGECAVLNFNYNFKGKNLQLIQQYYGNEFLAIRCDMNCCDKQKDFFSYQKKVDIDLPIAIDTSNFLLKNFSLSLEHPLLCGFPKRRYQTQCFGPRTSLVLSNLMAFEEDIPISIERQKIKTNEENHHLIKVIIYADKETRKSRLKKAMEMYKELGYKKVFFALRSESVHEDFKIWLKPFDLSNLETLSKSNDFSTVGEWLNTNSTTLN